MGHTHSRNQPLQAQYEPRELRRKASVPVFYDKPSRALSASALQAYGASTPALPHYPSLPPKSSETVSTEHDEKRRAQAEPPPIYTLSSIHGLTTDDPTALAYKAFLKEYPQYQLTWPIDVLRRTDFSRIDQAGETYVDYMGGALYPDSLVRVHANFLQRSVLGNTHSVNNL